MVQQPVQSLDLALASYSEEFTMQLLTSPMPLSPEVIDDRVATGLEAGDNITINYDDVGNVLTISAASAPPDAEYVTSTPDATLSAERVLTDTATVSWDRSIPGQIKATAGGVGGYTNEDAQDAVGSILQDSVTVDFIYNDATPYITGVVKDNSITESMLSLADNTIKNATTSAHGLLMKLNGTATNYLDGTGVWSVPVGGGGGLTVEQIQDLVAAMFPISTTLNFIYDDTAGTIAADIRLSRVTENHIALTDTTFDDATTALHGFLRKLSGNSAQYLDGNGNWTTPTSTPDTSRGVHFLLMGA